MNGVSMASLDGLVTAALTGQAYNQQTLEIQARLYARSLSNSFGKDLPEDLHGDVLSQAFVELMTAGPEALVGTGGKALFRSAVLSAIRTVRASHTPAGQRTRATPQPHPDRVAAEDIGRVADARAIERCTVGEGASRGLDFDLLESPAAAAAQQHADHCLEAYAILQHASPLVRTVLRLIYLGDEPAEMVATRLSLSRFALSRRIEAFCAPWRAAA